MAFRILLNLDPRILSMVTFPLWDLVPFPPDQWTVLAMIYPITSTIVLLDPRTASTMIWLPTTTTSAQSESRRTSTAALQSVLATRLTPGQLMARRHPLRTPHQVTLPVQLRSRTPMTRQIGLSAPPVPKPLVVLRIFSVMRRSTRLVEEGMTVRWRVVYLWGKGVSIDVISYWAICGIGMGWWTRRDSARWGGSREWSTEGSFEELDYFHTRSSQHSI